MLLNRVSVVMMKEVIDNIRDRRSITMAAIYPVIGPVMLGILLSVSQQMFRTDKSAERPPMVIAVEGAEYAPELISFLEEQRVEIVPAPPDLRMSVRVGKTAFAISVPENFGQSFESDETAEVQVIINATRLGTVMGISRTVNLLRKYNRSVTNQRMEALGLKREFKDAIKIRSVNVGQARSLAAFFLNMIPPFLIFTIFIGGVYLALDTTSGERERGSLEPLLTNPLRRWEFMLGKVGAAFIFTMAAVVIQLIAFKFMFDMVVEERFGISVNPPVIVFVKIFVICMPMMVLAVSFQIIIASVTRSFKETQTYLGLLPLIPSVPGMVMVFVTVQAHLWLMTIPFFSQVVLIGQLVRDEPVGLENVLMSASSTMLMAVVMLCVAGKLYSREQLLFSA